MPPTRVHAAGGLNFSGATATEAQVRSRLKRYEVYVLHRAGRVIGTLTFRTKEDEHGIAAYANWLAIDPEFQRSGLGSALLERAEREAVRRRLTRMRLDAGSLLSI